MKLFIALLVGGIFAQAENVTVTHTNHTAHVVITNSDADSYQVTLTFLDRYGYRDGEVKGLIIYTDRSGEVTFEFPYGSRLLDVTTIPMKASGPISITPVN